MLTPIHYNDPHVKHRNLNPISNVILKSREFRYFRRYGEAFYLQILRALF